MNVARRVFLGLPLLILAGCAQLNPVKPLGWVGSTNGSGAPVGLILWNKLGSASEVTAGAYGPGLSIVGAPTYSSGVYGNGVRVSAGNRIEFSSQYLLTNRGTMEFWVLPDQGFNAAQRFYFEIVDANTNNVGMYFYFNPGYPIGQRLYWVEQTYNFAFNESGLTNSGISYHMAFVWDYAGIGGAAATSQVYVNGTLMASSNYAAPYTFPSNGIVRLGIAWDDTRPYLGILDNLKIWNYARTNFSDRFAE